MNLIGLHDLVVLVLAVLGISYVVTRSSIGYLPRVCWCLLWRWWHRRFALVSPWSLVMCPPCNSWWVGGGLALLMGHGLFQALQVAFTSCGVMALLQQALGGDIAPADDMEKILEVQNGSEPQGT
jgi:hypothetical protein